MINDVLPPGRALKTEEIGHLRSHHRVSDAHLADSPEGEQCVHVTVDDTEHVLHWMLHEGWDTWTAH